jgi:hypothetical protein
MKHHPMKTTKKKLTFEEIITDDFASFIVDANRDLYQAEMEQDYHQCALILNAILLIIDNQAQTIQDLYGQDYKVTQSILKAQSDMVFEAIRNQANENQKLF